MDKVIDLKKSVFELCHTDSEIPNILYELGFHDIVKPGMLNTAGRFMTIPKGAAMKKISMDDIRMNLKEKGYTIQE